MLTFNVRNITEFVVVMRYRNYHELHIIWVRQNWLYYGIRITGYEGESKSVILRITDYEGERFVMDNPKLYIESF